MNSPNSQTNLQNIQSGRPSNTFIVKIKGGRTTAAGYPIALGYEVFLIDEENQMFFIKTNDPTGMGIQLREFSYEEVTPPQQNIASGTPAGFDPSKYATKEDLNVILAEIKKLQEGRDKGRSYNGRNRRSRNGSKSYDESI